MGGLFAGLDAISAPPFDAIGLGTATLGVVYSPAWQTEW